MTQSDLAPDTDISGDLLFGAEAIAVATGLTRRQVYHAAASEHMPLFKIGTTICGRRSTLRRWFGEQEARGRYADLVT